MKATEIYLNLNLNLNMNPKMNHRMDMNWNRKLKNLKKLNSPNKTLSLLLKIPLRRKWKKLL